MKIAFIGGWGHRMLRPALDDKEVAISQVAVASDGMDTERTKAYCAGLDGAQWYEDGLRMLDEFKPDIVNIGAVYGLNGDWVAAALERKIPVLTDKPVATTWAQLEQIERILEQSGGTLLTEFPFRTRAPFRAAKAAYQQGRIGEVVLVTAQKSYRFGSARPPWYADRRYYGGTVLWVASHSIDAAWFCTGIEFATVAGTQGNRSQPTYGTMEDHTVSLFRLANGGSCVVHADYLRPGAAPTHGDDRLRLAGTKGIIEICDGRAELISDAEGVVDITGEEQDVPFHKEVFAAIEGKPSVLGTAQSIYISRVLLQAREAGDANLSTTAPH